MSCPNGHENPAGSHFCGECGAPIAPPEAAVSWPAGASGTAHIGPLDSTENRPWYRKPRLVLLASIAVAFLISLGIVATVATRDKPPSATSVAEWWSRASVHVQQLANALNDVENSGSAAEDQAACSELHNAVAVDLQADMPTPDRDLTAAVQSMIDDVHGAAELCRSTPSPSDSDLAQFNSYLLQGAAHLETARGILAKYGITF